MEVLQMSNCPSGGLTPWEADLNYLQIWLALALFCMFLINMLFLILCCQVNRSRQSPSSFERGSVEKQKCVFLELGALSSRDLVVQTIFLSVLVSQIPIQQLIQNNINNQPHSHHYLSFDLSTYIMNKVAIQVSNRLTFFGRASFSKMLQDRVSNPIKDRVMSTPTWPVPYYQRIHRAYPVREEKTVNLSTADIEFNDTNWYHAKIILNESLKGRQIVKYTENNVKSSTYSMVKDDCESMSKSYVDDISQFLDLANRENVKILGGKTLI